MTEPLVEDLKMLEKGIKVFDALTESEIFVVAPFLCVLCDNVRASELLKPLGKQSKKALSFLYGKGFSSLLKLAIYSWMGF